LEKLPTEGDIDQVTFGFEVPLSEALNCCDWLGPSVIVAGATATDIAGSSVMIAEALLVASAALVAVTVTVCCVAMDAGAL
jgi:hypothetical protein